GTVFKRRIHDSGKKYVAWCCTLHIADKEQCSMQFIRQADLELAFVTMMNKLIFGKKLILKPLLESLRGSSKTDGPLQIQEIETRLEQNMDRIQTLTNLMTKGYLEPAMFTGENNRLRQEAEDLQKMKVNLSYEINGEMSKTEEVSRLLKFIEKAEMLTAFKAEVFQEYVDHITVLSREELAFNLKCGLSLKERV
ncbi:MAG: zinc ribbon domain-containing protein, partial [Niameybacter sp.]